jgi:hypothetical protein
MLMMNTRPWSEHSEYSSFLLCSVNTSIEFQEETYTQEPLVMRSKVRKALREVTGNKATVIDELPIELIKEANETALTALC